MRTGCKRADGDRGPTGGLHVALLRGVNVGGKNRLPMADLVALFVNAGCRDVATYIQSGNVVYRAGATLGQRLPGIVSGRIRSEFGLDVPVVTRTAGELIAAARANPFAKSGVDPEMLHVGFLRDRPTKDAVASLDPGRSPPDCFAVRAREIYFHLPNGVAKTRLSTPYLDGRLGTIVTVRNWNTVLKLIEMVGGGRTDDGRGTSRRLATSCPRAGTRGGKAGPRGRSPEAARPGRRSTGRCAAARRGAEIDSPEARQGWIAPPQGADGRGGRAPTIQCEPGETEIRIQGSEPSL